MGEKKRWDGRATRGGSELASTTSGIATQHLADPSGRGSAPQGGLVLAGPAGSTKKT